MHIVAIGGSDAGISAALRARELDPGAEVTVVVADAYPNFSICGIPYYVSGEVTHWRNLAHRTYADLEATGMQLRLDTTARKIDVAGRTLHLTGPDGAEDAMPYDQLVIGTGAVPVRPPIAGLDALGPGRRRAPAALHGRHLRAHAHPGARPAPAARSSSAPGYVGLEMAEALTARGLAVTQLEQLPEVLPTVDAELGALVHAELDGHGVNVAHRHRRQEHRPRRPRRTGTAAGRRGTPSGEPLTVHADLVLVVVGVRPDTDLAVSAGAAARRTRRDRGRRGHAHRPARRLRGRRLRRHPPPPARRDLPAARHDRAQARPRRRRERLGGHREFAGSLGTQVVKVFDLVAARTGLRDHEAVAAGFDPVTIAVRGRRPQGLLPRQPPDHHALHRRPPTPAGSSASSSFGHSTPRPPSASTSPPPPSTTA